MTLAQQDVRFENKPSRISQEKIQTVATILARGFVDDPMFEFTFPGRDTRLQALTAFFQPFIVDSMKRGKFSLHQQDRECAFGIHLMCRSSAMSLRRC
jgi:hypothetical protein